MLTSLDFAILSILTAKVDPENCRSISRRFTKQSVKCRKNVEKAIKTRFCRIWILSTLCETFLLFMDPDMIRYEIILIYIKISSKIDTVMYSKIYLGWELELCILSLYFHDVKLTKYLVNARYHSKSSFFYSVILVR